MLRRGIQFRGLSALLPGRSALGNDGTGAQRQGEKRRDQTRARRDRGWHRPYRLTESKTAQSILLLRIGAALCPKHAKRPNSDGNIRRSTLVVDRATAYVEEVNSRHILPVNPPRERMFNIPGAVLALAALLAAIHALELAGEDRRADRPLSKYAKGYFFIGAVIALDVIVMAGLLLADRLGALDPVALLGQWWVFVGEAIALAAFGAFWLLRTIETWGEERDAIVSI